LDFLFLPLDLHGFFRVHPTGWFVREYSPGIEINVMFDGSFGREAMVSPLKIHGRIALVRVWQGGEFLRDLREGGFDFFF